jgi:oligopeptidase A
VNEAESNPLCTIEFRVPFDRITAAHVEPAIAALLDEARAQLAALAADPGPRTFANTMLAYEALTDRLDYALGIAGHLEAVQTSPALRAAYNAVQPVASEFYAGVPLSAGLWAALRAYAATDEARALTGARRRFLDKTLADFRRAGAELDDAGKARLAAIEVELSELTLRYGQNVLDATHAVDVVVTDERRLAGLPERAVAAARASAAEKAVAGYRFTLQAPSYIAVVTHAADAALREQMYRAYVTRATRAPHDNRPFVDRILALRREKATLLGYADFADLVLDDRMLKTGAAAKRFLEVLRARATGPATRENAALLAFRRELEGPDAPELQPWDVAYYAEKQRRALHDFDDEALRPYFASDRVLAGLFAVAERLYGVRIEPWADAPVWHPSVRAYRVLDEAAAWLGGFYVDLFPREQKRDGAWMDGLILAVPDDRGARRQLALFAANVTPPVGDVPAMLTHDEVQTLFHEFGHLMHHLLTRVEVRSLAGTRVAWDFVELPSMIMENWCWEPEALALFARHHETGAPIPADLVARLRASRDFRAANALLRQVGYAASDLALHMDYDPARDGDPIAYARAIIQHHSVAPLPSEHAAMAAFGHLFSSPVGYAAGYYSYSWAEVMAADAFTRFRAAGVFDRATGERFRAAILARGNAEEAMDLYRSFMDREPDVEALFAQLGLTAPAAG